jgi:hypothetical protein
MIPAPATAGIAALTFARTAALFAITLLSCVGTTALLMLYCGVTRGRRGR